MKEGTLLTNGPGLFEFGNQDASQVADLNAVFFVDVLQVLNDAVQGRPARLAGVSSPLAFRQVRARVVNIAQPLFLQSLQGNLGGGLAV